MPIDYSKYPKNWPELRKQVLERAGHKCEWPGCGVPNYEEGWRDKEGNWYSFKKVDDDLHDKGIDYFDDKLKHWIEPNGNLKGPIKIVLTVAHLDHDETNPDVKIERLAAYCQYHHLLYDVDEKKRRRKEKKLKNSPELF